MSVPIRRLTTSQRPVFLVNSRPGLVTATPFSSIREGLHLLGAPLLPKLRGQFAEFLDQSSLERLRILSSPTCVGLRYGHPKFSLRGFSWQCDYGQLVWQKPHFPIAPRSCLPGFAWEDLLHAWTPYSNTELTFTPASPHRSNELRVVREC